MFEGMASFSRLVTIKRLIHSFPQPTLQLSDPAPPLNRLCKDSAVVSITADGVLQSLDFSLADLHFPDQKDAVKLRSAEEVAEPDEPLPLGLLSLAVLEPASEQRSQLASFLHLEFSFKGVLEVDGAHLLGQS